MRDWHLSHGALALYQEASKQREVM